MTISSFSGFGAVINRAGQVLVIGCAVATLSACSMFSAPKVEEQAIVPPEQLYQMALDDMDAQRFQTAVKHLQQLQTQHPYSDLNQKAKLMEVFANYRMGAFDEAVAAADRYLALYAGSKDAAYVLYLKGNAYYAQIKDPTRDQELSKNAIETYTLLINNFPQSDYAKDARGKLNVADDQLAAKEMSVGRYYLGNGDYLAAINRFRVVVEKYQTSTHIEEALFRLTEAYLSIGLIGEAQTATAVLGHNYPASSWYKESFDLLSKQGIAPQMVQGNWIADAQKR